jgi:hypothetical protein
VWGLKHRRSLEKKRRSLVIYRKADGMPVDRVIAPLAKLRRERKGSVGKTLRLAAS